MRSFLLTMLMLIAVAALAAAASHAATQRASANSEFVIQALPK